MNPLISPSTYSTARDTCHQQARILLGPTLTLTYNLSPMITFSLPHSLALTLSPHETQNPSLLTVGHLPTKGRINLGPTLSLTNSRTLPFFLRDT